MSEATNSLLQLVLRRVACSAVFAVLSMPAFAANYADCLLDNLPGVKNAQAHAAALKICASKFPDRFFDVRRGSGRGLMGAKSPEQCTLKNARDTSWKPSAAMISRSCACLYATSSGPTDMCERYTLPSNIREQHSIQSDAQLLQIETHYRRIYTAHPDADALFANRSFQSWWLNDPAKAKILSEGTTKQIIKLMSDFKTQARMTDKEGKPCTQITEFLGECKVQ